MIVSRIWMYVFKRFAVNALLVVISVCGIIFSVECIENLRRATSNDQSLGIVFALSALRLPWLAEQVLPLAVLIASMMTFLTLGRSHELTVARSTGMSAWQVIAPVMIPAAIIGLLATLVLNPVAAGLLSRHDAASHIAFGGGTGEFSNSWLRQGGGPEGSSSLVYARSARDLGRELSGVSIYLFDPNGAFTYRIEAEHAVLGDGQWDLKNSWTLVPGQRPTFAESAALATNLTPDQISASLANPEFVSFWDLSRQIETAERSGLNSGGFRLQYQTLLSRPVLFAAMVMIAASVSLRLFRFGNIARMILGGIGAGFLLYVVLKITGDLGAAGVISITAAAWAPAFLALLIGATMLLYTEDG